MRKSMTVGILVLFAGYTVVSYGYVLLKGWDIPFRNWIDPLHAWQFSGTPAQIPAGQVFPSQAPIGSFADIGAVGNIAKGAANAAAGASAQGTFGSGQKTAGGGG